jgi:hypothetical protein
MLSTCNRELKSYSSTKVNAWWHECNKLLYKD